MACTPSPMTLPEAVPAAATAPSQLSVTVGRVKTTVPVQLVLATTTWLPGQTNTGGSLSITVIVCWQVFELPQASVAVQVMVVTPFGYGSLNGLLSLRVPTMVGWLSQLSVAVAVPTTTVVEQFLRVVLG